MVIVMLFFLGIQFIKPGIENPAVTADIVVPDSIKQILKNACYDCHSNETKLSWFDKITPANWLVAKDIREGRKVLNFSEWDKLAKDRQKGILFESLNHIQYKAMPLRDYIFMHPKAKIDTTEINSLQAYLKTLLLIPAVDTLKSKAWNDQYKNGYMKKQRHKISSHHLTELVLCRIIKTGLPLVLPIDLMTEG